MKSSKELLLDLLVWSEKREIDLEKWILSIRLEKLTTEGQQQVTHGGPAPKLGSVKQLRQGVVTANDLPLRVGQMR